MLVLKICGTIWKNENRDKRELSVYCELGHEVMVMAKGSEGDYGRIDSVDGFKVLRYTTRPLGLKVPVNLNRALSLFEWAYFARGLKPDVITAHDLLPSLIIAWLSTFFKKKKPQLIYDSHEFELGRHNDGKRSRITTWAIAKIEKYLMEKCAFSIMVNDSIADEVQRIHCLKERPVVVRNTPNFWEIDERQCMETRKKLIAEFEKNGQNFNYLLLYHGGVLKTRGIERLIEAVSRFSDVGLVILGNGDDKYCDFLKNLAIQNKAEEKVLFHKAVPIEILWQYVGAVDVSIAPIELSVKNHYYSLPNKFFESIQSLTPIIAARGIEMKNIIDHYKIGLTCDSGDVNDICRCIEMMRYDKAFYNTCKENLNQAKKELCWENEKKILERAFREKIIT